MTDTPKPGAVYVAIADIVGELAKTGISKDRKNREQGYSFRGVDDVYNALAPLLAKHRLVILPRIVSRELTERRTAKGTAMWSIAVQAAFDFVSAQDGSRHVVETWGEAMDTGDKATNKAMSAAYKYACLMTFCVPTEADAEERDADYHTPEPVAVAKPQPPRPVRVPDQKEQLRVRLAEIVANELYTPGLRQDAEDALGGKATLGQVKAIVGRADDEDASGLLMAEDVF